MFDELELRRPRRRSVAVIASSVCALAHVSSVFAAPAGSADSQYFATTSMPVGRQAHGAAVVGNYLYVLGGFVPGDAAATTTISTVECAFAPIGPDGQIGQWQSTTPLPQPLVYIGNSTVARGRVIYICAGNVLSSDRRTNTSSNVVTMAAQREDGVLSRWITSEPFPGPGLQAAAAVATDTHLYICGGGDDNQRYPNVHIAAINPNGLLGAWSEGPSLPQGLWFHMAGTANNRVYVWGGTTSGGNAGTVATTYVADIQADGSLGAWQTIAPLPSPLYFSGSASLDGMLFTFAGRDREGEYTHDVLFASPDTAGALAWTRVRANVPLSRYLAPAVDTGRGIVYLPGGRAADRMTLPEVFGYRGRLEEIAGAFTPPSDTTEPAQTPVEAPAQTTPPPPPEETPPAAGTPGRWLSYEDAEALATSDAKNMLLYFATSRARQCQEVEEEILGASGFDAVAQSHACARIDAATQRDLVVTYGVFRVPTIVIVSPDGDVLATYTRNFTLEDLQAAP